MKTNQQDTELILFEEILEAIRDAGYILYPAISPKTGTTDYKTPVLVIKLTQRGEIPEHSRSKCHITYRKYREIGSITLSRTIGGSHKVYDITNPQFPDNLIEELKSYLV